MFPSLLSNWQSLIIYLVLIVVVGWLIIANAAASSAEQGKAVHGTPAHPDESHSPAMKSSPAASLHAAEKEAAPPSLASAIMEPAPGDLTTDSAPGVSAAASQEIPRAASDDLKVIEGIGPKIASVLQSAGINTFAQLAATDPARLETILRDASLHLADPATWPEQARLAAAGDWIAFDALTARLKGGRQV